jgi:hypothetical protein
MGVDHLVPLGSFRGASGSEADKLLSAVQSKSKVVQKEAAGMPSLAQPVEGALKSFCDTRTGPYKFADELFNCLSEHYAEASAEGTFAAELVPEGYSTIVLKGYHDDHRKLALFKEELEKLDAAAAPSRRKQYSPDRTIRQFMLVQRTGPDPVLESSSSAAVGLAERALQDVVEFKRQAVTSLMAGQLTPPSCPEALKPSAAQIKFAERDQEGAINGVTAFCEQYYMTPDQRFEAQQRLSRLGVQATVLQAPVAPAIAAQSTTAAGSSQPGIR